MVRGLRPMTLSSSNHSRTRASRKTSPSRSGAARSSRGSGSGLGVRTGDTILGRPRTPADSRVRLPKSRTVLEIPNGFEVVMRAIATGLPPPWALVYRSPETTKTGPRTGSVFNLPWKRPPRKRGGDGWESNPPRTPQQRPANGFEDRGPAIRSRPSRSAGIRPAANLNRVAVRVGPPPAVASAVTLALVGRAGGRLQPPSRPPWGARLTTATASVRTRRPSTGRRARCVARQWRQRYPQIDVSTDGGVTTAMSH